MSFLLYHTECHSENKMTFLEIAPSQYWLLICDIYAIFIAFIEFSYKNIRKSPLYRIIVFDNIVTLNIVMIPKWIWKLDVFQVKYHRVTVFHGHSKAIGWEGGCLVPSRCESHVETHSRVSWGPDTPTWPSDPSQLGLFQSNWEKTGIPSNHSQGQSSLHTLADHIKGLCFMTSFLEPCTLRRILLLGKICTFWGVFVCFCFCHVSNGYIFCDTHSVLI